jgi:hypothetical protein
MSEPISAEKLTRAKRELQMRERLSALIAQGKSMRRKRGISSPSCVPSSRTTKLVDER